MKYHRKSLAACCAVFFALVLVSQVHAGPPRDTYLPIRTLQEAENLRPRELVAVSCGNCGTVSFFTAGSDRSYLHSYTCPLCKTKFTAHTAGGQSKSDSAFYYEDKAGHRATLLHHM